MRWGVLWAAWVLGATATPCPLSFHSIGGGCYFYGYFRLNWFRALEFCHSFGRGASLASLETWEENAKVKAWLLQNGDASTGAWLGGSDNGHHGAWAWLPTGRLVQYSDWGPEQPSGGDQHCLYIVGGFLGYQWADFHCDFEMTFLCEFEANSGDVWQKPRLPQYSIWQLDNQWHLSTLAPPPTSPSTTSLPTTPSPPTSPPTTLFTLFNIPTKPTVNRVDNALRKDSKVTVGLQGETNLIEVLSSGKGGVIIKKKEETPDVDVTKEEDDTTWSIFQFLKNVIKMPKLLGSGSNFV